MYRTSIFYRAIRRHHCTGCVVQLEPEASTQPALPGAALWLLDPHRIPAIASMFAFYWLIAEFSNPLPARNQVATAPGNISLAPEVARSNSIERAKTDCWHRPECAIARSFRKRCRQSARHRAVLSARRPSQREREPRSTQLR
jgi:hypothetical protein